jgi:amidohydrolase
MPRPVLLAALVALSGATAAPAAAQGATALHTRLDELATAATSQVVAWRRDIHQHPELSGEEARTGTLVAEALVAMGIEVRANVAGHGVVGVLRGARPGPTVALRADMDALPVAEQTGLPFASTVRTTFRGQDVGVMHACGHDAHVAMLLGAAQVLSRLRDRLPGTVVFIFQPSEETPPGGAAPMIAAGVLDAPKVDAVFGLHVFPGASGSITVREGPTMASADNYRITILGTQTHGARPWDGIDPVVIGSQVVTALQTLVSRQTDLTRTPAVVTVGAFQGGVRENIIPDSAVLIGTIRTFDRETRRDLHARLRRTAEGIAQASGARATVTIFPGYPVTANDSALTRRMRPSLERVAPGATGIGALSMPAEDFSYFAEKVPGMLLFLGVTPPGVALDQAPANHSPLFDVHEGALPVGVRALASLAVDYLSGGR